MSLLRVLIFVLVFAATSFAATDAGYIAKFDAAFPKRSETITLDQLATPKIYDRRFLNEDLDAAIHNLTNDGGPLAWGASYRMLSLNEMYRATSDVKYLRANLRLISAVMAARDDRTGTENFKGEVLPAWGAGHYSSRGRTVFLVHTGMIAYPILDAISLARHSENVPRQLKAQFEAMLGPIVASVKLHDRQWKEDSNGEGYYIGMDEESVMEGRVQPANRLSAMGRALWIAWLLTHDEQYHHKCVAMGLYIKHRLTLGNDGAYYWPYRLPDNPTTRPASRQSVKGEDDSHGALTVAFPIMLADAHEVFDEIDMKRFGATFVHGIARTDGVLFGDVTGSANSVPDRAKAPARWIRLAPYAGEIKKPILNFYLTRQKPLNPIETALLIRYGGNL